MEKTAKSITYTENRLEPASIIIELKSMELEFCRKSLACTQASDAETFFNLSRKAAQASEKIQDSLKVESCWIYLSFIDRFNYSKLYTDYCEFCARNGLTAVNSHDYDVAMTFLPPQKGC